MYWIHEIFFHVELNQYIFHIFQVPWLDFVFAFWFVVVWRLRKNEAGKGTQPLMSVTEITWLTACIFENSSLKWNVTYQRFAYQIQGLVISPMFSIWAIPGSFHIPLISDIQEIDLKRQKVCLNAKILVYFLKNVSLETL